MIAFDFKTEKNITTDISSLRFDLNTYYVHNYRLLDYMIHIANNPEEKHNLDMENVACAFVEDKHLLLNCILWCSQFRIVRPNDTILNTLLEYLMYITNTVYEEFLDENYTVILPHLRVKDLFFEHLRAWQNWNTRISRSQSLLRLMPVELEPKMDFLEITDIDALFKKLYKYRR
jgi:hypothetical protein